MIKTKNFFIFLYYVCNKEGVDIYKKPEDKNKISKNIVDKIIENKIKNPNFSSKELSEMFNVSTSSINKILRENNCSTWELLKIKYRKYKVNDYYFQKINCPQKAYMLGLWYADGYLVKEGNGTKRIGIDLKDIDLLEDIKKEMQIESPLYKTSKENIKRIKITSSIMYEDLINLGCVENKTFKIDFPTKEQVPFEFLNSFLLGVLDGDGSIMINSPRKENYSSEVSINFTGTLELLEGIKKYLRKDNLKLAKRWEDRENNNYTLIISGIQQCVLILNLLYFNAPDFCLRRKKEKYEEILKDSRVKSRDLMLIPANPYDTGV